MSITATAPSDNTHTVDGAAPLDVFGQPVPPASAVGLLPADPNAQGQSSQAGMIGPPSQNPGTPPGSVGVPAQGPDAPTVNGKTATQILQDIRDEITQAEAKGVPPQLIADARSAVANSTTPSGITSTQLQNLSNIDTQLYTIEAQDTQKAIAGGMVSMGGMAAAMGAVNGLHLGHSLVSGGVDSAQPTSPVATPASGIVLAQAAKDAQQSPSLSA